MARKQAPKFKSPPEDQTWFIPKKGLDGEWYPLVRVGRHIPFGYEKDSDDNDILQPIPSELEMLEQAKKYLAEYSLRMVARWLSEQSGRYISHVGLKKRVNIEEKRRGKADAHRGYARRYKEASEKAEKLDKERLGGRATRTIYADEDSSSESKTS
jgi:hypothetical protein|tara:strand:- start:668 stop:1135 length:468 start_codon:yes stop_codon:yes gene_type:complete